ncbi:lipid II flippase Amj family protein [Abyssisolibacter fermentans]|uniref:lipid II flippase Amj family protein n=1 Tax=Abyssisolibacter fermentans TaxID=1766203 RepID=UPI00082E5D7C|nr:lipid II flippase Amj family protein [Abyssisolibacter fermentans]
MDSKILLVIAFTFIVHLINTVSYSMRIVGIRTGKIAVSFALFNVLALASRTANTLQGPLLAKTVENTIKYGLNTDLIHIFRMILVATTFASIIGMFLIPTFQRLFSKAVLTFDVYRSIPKLIFHSFSKSGVKHFKRCISIPSRANIKYIKIIKPKTIKIMILNIFAVGLLTTGTLASLYAGVLNPDFRTTASTLTPVITGFATVVMVIFIDPFLSVMTDDVIEGKTSESEFRMNIMAITISRIIGTLFSQVLLIPAAYIISFIVLKIL